MNAHTRCDEGPPVQAADPAARPMHAVVVERFGDPAQVLGTRVQALPMPGAGEVRLSLILAPIHTHDLELVRGEYGHRPALPLTPGTEAVGRVDAIGPGVAAEWLGQRMAVAGARATWASHFIARADSLVPVPEGLPDEAACQLLAMPLSASLLVDELALQPGEWVIQNAANGAVGRVVNALARRRGFQVINLVRSEAAAVALRAAGAEHVLRSDDPAWPQQVAALTQGAAVARAVDSLGGEAANDLLGVLGEGGTLVSFGSAVSLTLNVHVDHLLYRQTTLRGFWAAKRAAHVPAAERAHKVLEIIDLLNAGELSLTVEAVHDLADVAQAAVAAGLPGRQGKVALRAG